MNIKSILLVGFLLFIKYTSFGQNNNCDSLILSEKNILWTYNTDPSKKLYYTISFCKHNGIHPSTIEITKSDENDTSEIKGILKTNIGSFDLKDIDSTVASYSYQNDKTILTKEKNEKQSVSMVWEKWFGLIRFNIYAKKLPVITFEGRCVVEGFPWDDYDKLKKIPDWFRGLLVNEISFNAKTGILKYGGKQYNMNLQDGSGQLISVAAILFQNNWVRSKTWDLLKGQIKGGTGDYVIEQLFRNEETSNNVKIIKDAITGGNIGWFVAKSICTNINTAGNSKIEDVDLKFEQKLISEHPEIKVPSDMVIDKQFYFVINKLMVKTIMENKNVNEIEAEQILKANPEIEKFIKPYNPSIIRQN